MSKQDDTDGLPYTQIDRAVAPKVAGLAGLIGTTTQHAKGSLIDWWELHSEPRQLEKLVREGKTEILLTAEECRRSFRIASGGKTVDPDDLVALGLAEKTGADVYRVRGMSRAFAPILKRIQLRKTASEGGKKSAESRSARFGTARPNASGDGSEPPKHSRTLSDSDQRATINDQRSEITDRSPEQEQLSGVPEATPKQRELSLGEDYHLFFIEKRAMKFTNLGCPFVADEPPNPAYVNASFKRIDSACGDSDVVCDLINEYFAQDWPAKYAPPYPFSAFTSGKVWPKLLQQLRGEPA